MSLQDYQDSIRRRKQDDIIAAALDVFLDVGYDRATLAAIAKTADVSTATLYKYFKTKADLFTALVDRLFDDLKGVLSVPALKGRSVKDGLTAIGEAYARLLTQEQSIPLARIVIAETKRFPELSERLQTRGKAPMFDGLKSYLDEQVAMNTLSIADTDAASHTFMAMIGGRILLPKLFEAGERDLDSQAIVNDAVEMFLARYRLKH